MDRIKRLFAALLAAAVLTGCSANSGEVSVPADTSVGATVEGNSDGEVDTPVEEVGAPAEGSSDGEVDTPAEEVSVPAEDSSDGEESAPAATTKAPEDEGTTQTFVTTSTPEPEPQPSEGATAGLTVSYSVPNSWEEGGMCCTQLDFTVRNSSAREIGSWQLTLGFGQSAEVMQSWNASVTSQGGSVVAANVEYNGNLPVGGETTFGIIVKTPAAVGDIAITSDGVSVGAGGSAGGSTGSAQQTSAAQTAPVPEEREPAVEGAFGLVSDHGRLSVKGTDLVDESGEPMQLRGVSTHGIQWFPQFANKSAFKHLRDEWNINVIRLAMYSGAGEGYTDSTKAGIEQTVRDAVDACIELDMYVIIDWHVLADQSPQVRKADALRFFGEMSARYADCPNVIYEICNEPNGYATWEGDIKPYAEEVIPVIRANDPDSVIIVGTPTWSQDIDKALASPLSYDNVMYALHYYAATHTDWLRDRLKSCYRSGLPIMVTEFGNCDASGNGSNNLTEAKKWLELLDSLNISYMNWSLCDKSESASLLKSGASPTGGWSDSDLTENGKFMRDWFREHD